MKKIICLMMSILYMVVGLLNFGAIPAYAEESGQAKCEHSILGLRPWYSGLTMGGDCVIQSPKENEITKFVWQIILNVLSDIFLVAGYLALGFVIYGGILYIMSAGNPSKVAKGKQTLISAAIGLVITLLATVIINIIIAVLSGATT